MVDNNNSSSSSTTNTVMPPLLGSNQVSPFSSTLSQSPSIKLDKNNYLLWKNTTLPIIKGHNLEGFILGTNLCPDETISVQVGAEDGGQTETKANPEYQKWKSMDQLLLGWLYTTMTAEIVMKVMELKTLLHYGMPFKKTMEYKTDQG